MADNIVHINKNSCDGRKWTVEQMLGTALAEVKSGDRKTTKAVVIYLDDSEGGYAVGFTQAGLTMSQMLGLLDIAKAIVRSELGYGSPIE